MKKENDQNNKNRNGETGLPRIHCEALEKAQAADLENQLVLAGTQFTRLSNVDHALPELVSPIFTAVETCLLAFSLAEKHAWGATVRPLSPPPSQPLLTPHRQATTAPFISPIFFIVFLRFCLSGLRARVALQYYRNQSYVSIDATMLLYLLTHY